MVKRFWNWVLDQSAAGCMWLALHLECRRVGHDWQLSPNFAWCEHCEDEVKGETARRLYEAKYGPYVVDLPPEKPWPLPTPDLNCPHDSMYFLDMSQFGRLPDGSIIDVKTERVIAPSFGIPMFKNAEEIERVFPGWNKLDRIRNPCFDQYERDALRAMDRCADS